MVCLPYRLAEGISQRKMDKINADTKQKWY